MKAVINKETGLIELRDGANFIMDLPKFKRFVGGIGWGLEGKAGDFSKTWVAVFGELEDKRIMQVAEAKGTLQQIGKEAINQKDLFLCERFYVDASEVHNQKVRYLRDLEGFTFYTKKQGVLRPIYPTDTKTWPNFRPERPKASVVPIPDDVRVDLAAGFSNIHALATQQKELIFYGPCERLADLILKSQIKDRKPEETYSHPLVSASVFAVSMLVRSRPQGTGSHKEIPNPYMNRKR